MTENALKCQYNGGSLTIGYTIDENKHYQLDTLVAPLVMVEGLVAELSPELNIINLVIPYVKGYYKIPE